MALNNTCTMYLYYDMHPTTFFHKQNWKVLM